MLTACLALRYWRQYDRMDTRFTHLDIEMSDLKTKHADELKKARSEPTMDCRELLHDLTNGAALVKITPISPLDIYIKR